MSSCETAFRQLQPAQTVGNDVIADILTLRQVVLRRVWPTIGIAMRKASYDRIILQRQTGMLWMNADQYEESHPKRRFRLLRGLIRKGHNDSGLLQNLAFAYAEGQGTKPNRSQALRWNRKAWRRGSGSAACNAGIDARLDGRQSLAAIWFRRAIAMGSSDALLQLAKLFFQHEDRRVEAISLLHRRIAMGPEQMFEVGGPIDDQRPLPDEDLAEAKRLLNELEAGLV